MRGSLAIPLALVLPAVSLSCSRVGTESADRQETSVTFSVDGAATRAVQDVSSLDVLVFRSGGILDTRARAQGPSVTARVTAGVPLDCRLVANMPEGLAGGVLRGEDLDSTLCTLESQALSLTMTSSWQTRTFSAQESCRSRVSRLAMRVTVDTIVSALESADVILRGVYLTNVAGTCPLDPAFTGRTPPHVPAVWYNRMRLDLPEDSPLRPMLCDMRERRLLRGEDELLDVSLICFPNPVSNTADASTDPGWCPRPTRLVLETDVDGRTRWYPVTLPVCACNSRLHISRLTVSGPGSPDPDIPVDRVGVSFSMEILPWDVADVDVSF